MQNKKIIALIILSIGAVISLIYGIFAPTKVGRQFSSKPAVVREIKKVPLAERIMPAHRYTKRTKYREWGKSPFIDKEVVIKRTPALVLNGIAWDEKSPVAVVNDDVVRVGDNVDGNRIVAIEPNKVVFNDGTDNFELTLGR